MNRFTCFIKVYKNKNKEEEKNNVVIKYNVIIYNVVYKISCKNCDVEQTKKQLWLQQELKNINLTSNLIHQNTQWL